MADYQTIKVTLGQVTTNTGKVCKNPIIKLEGYPNIYINCVDPSCGLYELQLPDNEDPKCLIFSVSCDLGECPTCDTQLIKKCFCEDTGDCPDCNICIKKPGETSGFCEPLCDAAHCCDGACRECCESKQCPCNQVCNANGNCVCPPGTFIGPDNECCIECDSTHPCPPCHECIGGKCEPIDCPDGICDPTTGTCVDCITGDQCDENECCEDNKCVCCEGFVRNNCTGECVPLPPNACTSSSDCPVCSECRNFDPCTGVGSCLPTTCPPGKVPVDVDGVCRCLTECDCDDPDCPNVTDGCNDFVDVCACLPCEGDCASGCEDPCYCNPQTNRCEQNPCVNVSCRTGLDCGEGCGCDTSTGTCVPCATLDCVGSNAKCEQVLGCGCVGNRCEDEDCDNIPCSTYSDCPFGCTCDKGKCVSCSNFPCPVDCANQPGCGCVGNECEGAEEECEDELTLEKNDDNCTLTGKLIKDNCCQCSPLTLDIKGQTISQTTDSAVISFIAEGRKGAFNGDVNANPKLDEFSNPNIASSGVANDTPLSGTFTLNYTVYYNLLSLETGAIIGRTQNTLPGGSATFAANTATATFANVTLPKIGSRTTTDTNIKVVTEIRLTFRLTSAISIANNCVYNSGATIEYRIQSSSGLSAFSTSGYGNGRGTEVTSSSCRYPFFKWSKDGQLFRKVYVPGGPTYTDTLTKQLGLESCKTYLLETDCNCKDPISKYIVFCNPSDLDFTVDPNSCGKCITINSFDTCDVNEDKEFYVTGGSLNIKWIGDNAPIGQKMCSTTTIDQLKFGLTCDVQNQCTKTYNIEGTDLEITPDISECEPDSTEFTVVFPDTDDNGTCLVDYIKVGGHTLTDINDFSKKLAIGKYTATVYWKCGCDPTEVTFEQDCCDGAVDDISRQCNGAIICEQDPSVVYKLVTGTTKSVLNDVCGYVSNLGPNDSVVIEAQRGNCTPVTKVIPALGSSCCEDFQVLINQISANVAEVMVVGGTNYVLTAVNTTSGNPVNISQNGPQGHYTVSGYVEGDNIVVTATDQSCPVEIAVFEAGGCSLSVLMEEYEEDNRCRLKASVEGLACQCNLGQYIVSINEGGISDNGTSFTIPYTTSFMGFDDILPV
ncbi:MAG: hypothetical protein J5I47_04640, partial [Vicingus serpentipes]|nr:hypothetical protein [Vicingus serpentipes]